MKVLVIGLVVFVLLLWCKVSDLEFDLRQTQARLKRENENRLEFERELKEKGVV